MKLKSAIFALTLISLIGCAARPIVPTTRVDNTIYYTYDSVRFEGVIRSAVEECAKDGKKPDMSAPPSCASQGPMCFRGMCDGGGAVCVATFTCK